MWKLHLSDLGPLTPVEQLWVIAQAIDAGSLRHSDFARCGSGDHDLGNLRIAIRDCAECSRCAPIERLPKPPAQLL